MAITKDIQLFQNGEAKKVTLKDHLAYRNREPETVAKDFNTYTETGFYTWSITANILQDCANRPCDEFGTLEVKNDNTAIIYQRYEANNNVVYIRTFYNEAWTEWDIEVNKDYVDSEIDNIEISLNNMQSTINEINQNVAKKINRTDTKTFFLEPSKWTSEGKYTLDVTGFGWTANTIIQINAPMPESNTEVASGISIESQTSTQVVLKAESVPTEPVILTLLYGGEEITGYYCADEVGEQTITWTEMEEQTDESIIFIANPDLTTENLKDIHTNNLTFQCQSAYTEVVADSLLRFGGYAFHSNGNGYAYTNLASTNFDLSQPWLVHFYVNFKSSESVGPMDGVSTFLGFGTSGYNGNLLRLDYKNGQTYDDNNRITWQLQVNGSTTGGSRNESDPVNANTYSQYQLLYDGTNLRLLKKSSGASWYEVTNWQISLSNQNCYFYVGPRSSKDSRHIRLGTVLLRQSNELPEIVTRSDWENKQCWSSTHLVEVEKSETIQVTEKSWYDRRSDGLYKWDTTTNAWVKQTTTTL